LLSRHVLPQKWVLLCVCGNEVPIWNKFMMGNAHTQASTILNGGTIVKDCLDSSDGDYEVVRSSIYVFH
jgi:hypothetical protein